MPAGTATGSLTRICCLSAPLCHPRKEKQFPQMATNVKHLYKVQADRIVEWEMLVQ